MHPLNHLWTRLIRPRQIGTGQARRRSVPKPPFGARPPGPTARPNPQPEPALPSRTHAQAGLTLLELVVAVAVLSIGSLAAVRATDQSRHAIAGDPPRLLARVVARNRAEELRFTPPGQTLPASVQMAGRTFSIQVARLPTAAGLIEATITVRSSDGPGAILIAYLPGQGG